jgi:hypothetical protein
MSDNLQKMFIEDAPQDLDNLKGVENLSALVLELQKIKIYKRKSRSTFTSCYP